MMTTTIAIINMVINVCRFLYTIYKDVKDACQQRKNEPSDTSRSTRDCVSN